MGRRRCATAHTRAARTAGRSSSRRSTVKAIETNIRQEPEPLVARSDGVVDFAHKRADLTRKTGRKTEVVYNDLVVYATRSPGIAGGEDNAVGEVRLRDTNRRTTSTTTTAGWPWGPGSISPVIALEVLEGVLTGSVKQLGTGMKAGAQTTRYSARLAPDAAIIEIRDEERKEGVERMFETLAVQADDFIVDVWIDAEDRVRGLRFNLEQQKDRVNRFETTVSWEFADYGAAESIEQPPGAETIRSDRFRDFVTEVIREFG